MDKIICPACHKRNEVQKFCIYCGHRLLGDEEIELIFDNPEPYCLNCGRPVKRGQLNCECGYQFRDISCPKCNTQNSYVNRFCTDCGEKLWKSDVCKINYGKITQGIIRDKFPKELRNTILHARYKKRLAINFPDDFNRIGSDEKTLKSNQSRVDNHLSEIISRWKIVSPHFCINCFIIMKMDEYRCKNCGTVLPYAEKRVDQVKNKKYVKPVFDMAELKWNSKFSENYLDSLAPDMGESQFEYRERLKWEFAENNNLKKEILDVINRAINRRKQEEQRRRQEAERIKQQEELKRQIAERRKQEEEYIRQYGGGYCSSTCRHYYEEILTPQGISIDYTDDMYGVDYCCSLGHSVSLGSFCKDYE